MHIKLAAIAAVIFFAAGFVYIRENHMSVLKMPTRETLSGPRFAPVSGQSPKQLIVLLHGLGADGNDLIGLANEWSKFLPDAEFVSPNAPYPCDMAPMGFQWFSLQDYTMSSIYLGAKAASDILNRYIDQELQKRNLSDRDLALVGFSQGTMMALHVSLRRSVACAAVLGYSGALAGSEELRLELKSKPNILLIHGDQDMVVPMQASVMAEKILKDLHCDVKSIIRPGLGHGIDSVGIDEGGHFLQSAFSS